MDPTRRRSTVSIEAGRIGSAPRGSISAAAGSVVLTDGEVCGGGSGTLPKSSTFKVTLSIRREPSGSPVYCKMDGRGRFKQSKTVKLATDSIYRVDVSFKPPRILRSLAIGGQDTLARERTRDGTASAYSGHYSTKGLTPSGKGQREDLHIQMRVREAGDVCTCLQVKVYRADDQQHSEWGNRLHCIELDCSTARGERAVTVNRETYRLPQLKCNTPEKENNISTSGSPCRRHT
ncbi:CB1 cannabinoid receptor-interacting protein 1-like isoform X2 [Ischnura elegans]|uniref:CB1 cannabinoid receptor-interacting protein 1-like isoform X2 n=1 Tax=Ischnura elegans TaxID=197161 RepID=UPI001ED889DC|nr:CB1 cannabinoid receptor-interacting protein 1-like isoform X2 [Ischnura elegans]